MKGIQQIILAFMLGMLPIQAVWADRNADLLVDSALNGDLAKIKQLVEQQGVDVNAQYSSTGGTALMYASLRGHLEIVKYLISKGADVNAKNDDGWTALMYASLRGHLEIVKYLISKGADINAKNDNGLTALMAASGDKGKLEIIKALVEGKGGLLSVFSKGADVNAQDDNGETALMRACANGKLEIVKYLISKGADVNAKITVAQHKGLTALIGDSFRGYLEVVKYLVSKGADINAKSDSGMTALNVAKTNAIKEVLRNARDKK